MTKAQTRFADALQRVLPTTVARFLPFRGWICQETLYDRSLATFRFEATRRQK